MSAWIERTPWAMRALAALILIFSPVIYTVMLWCNEWSDIKEGYRELFKSLRTGK